MTHAARHPPLIPLGALLAGLLVGLLAAPGPARAQPLRLAVVAGNDRGGERRASLRYAEADARRVAGLLVELGGFEPGRVRLVLGGGPDDVLAALDGAEAELVRDGRGDGLLLFYFSGHADGVALELGREQLPFATLRERLLASRARIRIGLVDACQSGALTGAKGGRPAPAFELLPDERLEAEGTAFLTSSAAGELSQESAEVQGSFFTTYLLSGLRGAADLDGDRRVTLAEVYQYAYARTLEDTARTLAGPQHPTYEMRLIGQGGVVLTDLTRRRSALLLGPELAGELLVLSAEGG
ncbi:MAG TPA: caspase family protein, partial [Myxococcota bacterium]|nr:caspase family protein [Myxococcota bacterium]